MVLTGTIKNYNIERGFGFISTSNFGDVFFHIKDFQKGEQPIPGREVYFEVVKKENKIGQSMFTIPTMNKRKTSKNHCQYIYG